MNSQLIDEATDCLGIHAGLYSIQGKHGALYYMVKVTRVFSCDKTKSLTRFLSRSEANNMFIGIVKGLGLYQRGKE